MTDQDGDLKDAETIEEEIHKQIARTIALDVPRTPKSTFHSRIVSTPLSDDGTASIGTVDRIGTQYRANQDTITPDQEQRADWHESLYRLNCEYNEKYGYYFSVSTRLPRRVMTSINLKRVGDIDMRGESFRALFHVYLNWLPTKEEYKDLLRYYFHMKSPLHVGAWLEEINKFEAAAEGRPWFGREKYPVEFLRAIHKARVDGFILIEQLPSWEKIDDLLAEVCPDKDTWSLFPPDYPDRGNWDGFWNEFMNDMQEEVKRLEHYRLENGGPWKPSFVPRMEPRNTVNVHVMDNEVYPMWGHFKIAKFKKFSKGMVERAKLDDSNGLKAMDMTALARSFWIRQRMNFDVTFSEELELDSFPFDYQDLTIPMRENSNASKCVLTPELRDGRFFACDPTGFALQEYRLVAVHLEVMKMPATRGDIGYSAMIIRVKMKRNWRYYIWRVVLQMALITGLSLCAFTLDQTQKSERLAYLVTLLLTAVAFQTVIQDELPNTPYMTRMDEYILICFMFMSFITIWTSIVFREGSRFVKFDEVVFWIATGGFVLYHVIYLIMITFVDSSVEKEKIDKNPLLEQREKEVYFHRKPVKFKVADPIERLSTDPKKEWFRYSGMFDEEEVDEPKTCCDCINDCMSFRPFRSDDNIDDLPKHRDYCRCEYCLVPPDEKKKSK